MVCHYPTGLISCTCCTVSVGPSAGKLIVEYSRDTKTTAVKKPKPPRADRRKRLPWWLKK